MLFTIERVTDWKPIEDYPVEVKDKKLLRITYYENNDRETVHTIRISNMKGLTRLIEKLDQDLIVSKPVYHRTSGHIQIYDGYL